jgi:hypothetical protein
LEELERASIFSRNDAGVIFSRRMVRDEERRQMQGSFGFLGGNPTLIKGYPKVPKGDNPFGTSSSSSSIKIPHENDTAIFEDIFDRLQKKNPTLRRPDSKKSASVIQKLREETGTTWGEIWKVFKWAQANEFWSGVIVSVEALRKNWDKLIAQSSSKEVSAGG